MKLNKSVLTLLALCFALNAQSQGFLKTNGTAIENENGDTVILRGMGLGGWMLQEGYMLQTAGFANAQYQIKDKIEQLVGTQNMELFYDAWLENHVRKADIDSLKSWGFNSVRLPMHYNLYTLPIEEEPVAGQHTWLDRGFVMTDSLISWCKQNDMYVVLDLHAAPGGQGYDQGISDYDPSKPSLWESQENQDKMIALWKRLAERYVDEPYVAGYDLLNETNWDLPGGSALRNLYQNVTTAIRSVDMNHIIFIEGNWFANDFTGLTPPWDDNFVYSPHKYWSTNDQGSIQWALDLRNTYNVPIYFGESGENSNTWFRDAIKLIESEGIGWAWWPMKKIESISGPLSVKKTTSYQSLLNYWNNGGTAPAADFAFQTLLQLTEELKIENCTFQKDVIDAMFRQVNSDETIPYNTQPIPGIVYAADFDMGLSGEAYFDTEVANYHVSTGNYTAWNNGWIYRNDGVDIEKTSDPLNTLGYNVGWVAEDEWMQYDVQVASAAVYDIKVRVASGAPEGQFHFAIGNAPISDTKDTWNTGGWQNWNTFTLTDVILTPADTKIRFYIDKAEFNVSSFEFIEVAPLTSLATKFFSAETVGLSSVQLNLNKPIAGPITDYLNDFEITVNGTAVPLLSLELDIDNNRIILFEVDHDFKASDVVKISYSGNEVQAVDASLLNMFLLEDVQNNIPNIHPVPGKLEAEDFFFQQGIELEATSDVGGGENVGYMDQGDYMDYYIDAQHQGIYDVFYRVASESNGGQVQLQTIEENGTVNTLHTINFNPTGGWQSWQNYNQSVFLTKGVHQLRVLVGESGFNLNWLDFVLLSTASEEVFVSDLNIFPNPSSDVFLVQGNTSATDDVLLNVTDFTGKQIQSIRISGLTRINEKIDLSKCPPGIYQVTLLKEDGSSMSRKIVKL